MDGSQELVLAVGSRTGAVAALVFFALVFGVLGTAVARELHRRAGWRRAAVAAALAVSLVPVALVYVTSVQGYYEVRLSERDVTLSHLLPSSHEVIPLASIDRVEARPAFRGAWRVHLVTRHGDRRHSAQTRRRDAEAAARQIQERVASSLR